MRRETFKFFGFGAPCVRDFMVSTSIRSLSSTMKDEGHLRCLRVGIHKKCKYIQCFFYYHYYYYYLDFSNEFSIYGVHRSLPRYLISSQLSSYNNGRYYKHALTHRPEISGVWDIEDVAHQDKDETIKTIRIAYTPSTNIRINIEHEEETE